MQTTRIRGGWYRCGSTYVLRVKERNWAVRKRGKRYLLLTWLEHPYSALQEEDVQGKTFRNRRSAFAHVDSMYRSPEENLAVLWDRRRA